MTEAEKQQRAYGDLVTVASQEVTDLEAMLGKMREELTDVTATAIQVSQYSETLEGKLRAITTAYDAWRTVDPSDRVTYMKAYNAMIDAMEAGRLA